mgnify:CR=1 FL=1
MFRIITRQDWKTSQWSGGETNEIYIYPEDGSYKDRNFQARISIANTKDYSKSEFTFLPAINRFISILEGEMELTFPDRYTRQLKPFDIEEFSGDWPAYSTGKYVDFNFMIKGTIGHLYFETTNGKFTIKPQYKTTNIFIFVVSGHVILDKITIESYDLIITNEVSLSVDTCNASFYYGYF